jgi:predicted benzoate:H+ symporter BenE
LLTLLFAAAPPEHQRLSYFLAGFLVLSIFMPMNSGVDPRLVAIVSAIPHALTVALAAFVFHRFAVRPLPTAHRPA